MKYLPDPREYPDTRLFSLDLLRGIDMFYLVCLGGIWSLFAAMGCEDLKVFFSTHQWGGFTLCDLIMPLFIFMCGAALPLAMKRRLDPQGRPTAAFHVHVWSRFAMLWVFGMLAQGNLASLNPCKIAIYSNTLQTIAVGYVVAAYVLLVRSRLFQIAVPVTFVIFYALYVHFAGDYSVEGNATKPIELWVLRHVLPANSEVLKNTPKAQYTWFLPSLMMPVITLAGAFSTEILMARHVGEWRRAARLAAFGLTTLLAGFLLEFLGIQKIKQFFTASFTLQATGYSILLLATLYVIADIRKFRKGTGLFLLFGQFALAAYFCKAILHTPVMALSERFFGGFRQFVPVAYAPVVLEVGFVLSTIALVALYRLARIARDRA